MYDKVYWSKNQKKIAKKRNKKRHNVDGGILSGSQDKNEKHGKLAYKPRAYFLTVNITK